MHPPVKELCLICKGGRLLCGLPSCPLLQKVSLQKPLKQKLSRELFGPAPSIFVGWQGYPNVSIGPLTSLSKEKNLVMLSDNPGQWYGFDFDEIINLRSNLVRSKRKQPITGRSKFIHDSQELALSIRPTDVETIFTKKPTYHFSFSAISQPMGPSGEIKKFTIAENTKIPKKVDSLVHDELLANDVTIQLYENDFDVYYLTTILSSGALGLEKNKKLVPTRWSITAIDDILAKELMKRIRNYPLINDCLLYSNEYLHNHFEILLLPGVWEFEQFEAWAPKTFWTAAASQPLIIAESEPFQGRTSYATKEGGGYYAGRFAVVEALNKMKKQARAIVFREISEGYVLPVGVWEVRENVRRAFQKNPLKFTTLKEALQHLTSRLHIPLGEYLKHSELLKQRKLNDWL